MQSEKDLIQWGKDSLKKTGYALIGDEEIIQKTPYSCVVRFLTSQGNIYLKKTPPSLFIEVEIIKFLKYKINTMVPSILEVNKELCSFLMLDAGIPLQEYLKENFQPNLLNSAIKQYTDIQYAVSSETEPFLKLGVPDWRLKNLSNLYQKLINKKDSLQKDGLTESEYNSLKILMPTVTILCDMLSQYNIPETLDHCDFHDNNILINTRNIQLTLIDLGEIVITHPFFSLLSFISKAALRYSLNDAHHTFIELLDTCVENWYTFGNKIDLKQAMLVAKKLWPIYSALGYYRLISTSGMGMDEASLLSYFGTGRNAGRFAKYFKDFINANLDVDPNDFSHVQLSYPGSRLI